MNAEGLAEHCFSSGFCKHEICFLSCQPLSPTRPPEVAGGVCLVIGQVQEGHKGKVLVAQLEGAAAGGQGVCFFAGGAVMRTGYLPSWQEGQWRGRGRGGGRGTRRGHAARVTGGRGEEVGQLGKTGTGGRAAAACSRTHTQRCVTRCAQCAAVPPCRPARCQPRPRPTSTPAHAGKAPLQPGRPRPRGALRHGRRQPGEQPRQPLLLRPGPRLDGPMLQLGQQGWRKAQWQHELQRGRQHGVGIRLPKGVAAACQAVEQCQGLG